jgi:hypothetical protein
MNVVILSIALATPLAGSLTSPLVIPVGDRVPAINIEANCKATAATDKAMNLDLPQSVEKCMRDEDAAKQQIAAVWSTYPAPTRDRCEQEATIGGIGSYVDLLTCMQMTDPAKLSPTPGLGGASKNRDKN